MGLKEVMFGCGGGVSKYWVCKVLVRRGGTRFR